MGATEAQKRAALKWNKSRDSMTIRPDKKTGAAIRAAAAEAGQSNQQYILQATMDRINGSGSSSDSAGSGADHYNLDRGKIEKHIEKTGETAPEFVNRAVNDTIKRDDIILSLGIKPNT